MGRHKRIGSYRPEDTRRGIPERISQGWSGQGWIYWNPEAYERGGQVCYIPELFDDHYTREDFLELAEGQKALAEDLFYSCSWQSPSTLLDEEIANGELARCRSCGRWYYCYGKEACPYCGRRKEAA